MPIRVVCAECGAKLDIREELAGVKRKCPKCKREFVVPNPDDDSEGVELAAEDEPATSAPTNGSGENDAAADEPVPAAARSAPALNAGDDDDDEDYIPSFVIEEKPKSKSSAVVKPAAPEDDDDEPVLSIPTLPPPTKPKFKPFDPDEFADEEPDEPRRSSKSTPVPSARDRSPKSRVPDEFDDEPPSRPRGSRGMPKDFDLPEPSKTSLSDSSIPATSGTRDRAQAARELRQALKDSALRAPPEQRGGRDIGFDFSAFMSEIGLKALAIIGGLLVVLPLAYFAGDRMTGGGLKLPKLAHVSGTVTYNGTPAAGAIVYMQSMEEPPKSDGKKKTQLRTSFGVADEQGHFKMMYMEGVAGAAVGKNRVWAQPATPVTVAGDFSSASVTVRDIAAGSQTVDIPLAGPQQK